MYTLQEVYNFISQNKKVIEQSYVTSITQLNFNDMEGYSYQINVKVITKKGYKNKLLKVLTNSTYIEDFETDENDFYNSLKQCLNEWFALA